MPSLGETWSPQLGPQAPELVGVAHFRGHTAFLLPNSFKSRLDEFWSMHDFVYDYRDYIPALAAGSQV